MSAALCCRAILPYGRRYRSRDERESLSLRDVSARPSRYPSRRCRDWRKRHPGLVAVTGPLVRRDFLTVSATAVGGLLLGVWLPPSGEPARAGRAAEVFEPNAFLRIEPSGVVTIVVPRPDMGTGVRTALAMLVADELDADWSTIRIEQADLDENRYGPQYAGGSAVVRTSWEPLRRAGAAARMLLVSAAARGWGVDPSQCRTTEGAIVHAATGRRATYGTLVAEARTLPVPDTVVLKQPAERRIIGRPTRSLDAPAIVRGSITYGIDVRLRGMLHAVIERSPVFGGQVGRVDDHLARARAGVRSVVRINADSFPRFGDDSPKKANGVAVVADSTWSAIQGRRALVVEWDPRGGESESTRAMRLAAVDATRDAPRFVARHEGDVEAALASAARRLDAVYEVPLLAHATMEPMNCTADVTSDRCEIWAPTQNPQAVRDVAAVITGLAPSTITVHVTRMGGGFGRRFYPDFAGEAVIVSKAVGRPVQVTWTREDDIKHDFYRPAGYHVMQAGLDDRGRLVAWTQHLASASRGAYLGWTPRPGSDPGVGELEPYDLPAGVVPNLRIGYTPIASRIPRGQWRAVEPSATVFVTQSFLAEVAIAAARDPLEYQLELLATKPQLAYYGSSYDTRRLAAVLRLAAERGAWGRPMPKGWGRGIAGSYANSAFVAHVVEVEAAADGTIRVHRVVSAVDAGTVVNPLGVQAQVEGGVVFGLSAALKQEITVEGGRVVQSNFHDFDALRMSESPRIEVYLIPSEEPVCGMGEAPIPPTAPALTNAIFNATGVRIRALPIDRVVKRAP
jgi:isoquinoline 1-oxidoreductase beta subunit